VIGPLVNAKAIGPGKPYQGQFDQSRRRGVGKAGIGRRDKGHKPKATVGPTDDIAGDNLELLRACKPAGRPALGSRPGLALR
jgi:hypothetical protein